MSAQACGDDDDDSSATTAGSSGRGESGSAGRGGSSGHGGSSAQSGSSNTAGTVSLGGDTVGPQGGSSGTGAVSSRAGAESGGAGGAGADSGGAATGGDENGGAGGAAALQLSDGQIVLVLDTLNQGEVDEAYAVLPRVQATAVRTFALEMANDHSSARQAVAQSAATLGVTPAPSATQAQLKTEGEEHVALLRREPTPSLDLAYMNLEIDEHRQALDLLAELESAADAPALKQLITTLTATVQMHYDQAVTIAAAL